MRRIRLVALVILAATALTTPAGAADRVILGKKLLVRNPTGAEASRVAVVLAKETGSELPAIAGDPTVNGATLRVITAGVLPREEYYGLDASNWSATPTGYVFRNSSDTDPVLRAILKRTPAGIAFLKVVMNGNTGTRDLDLVPPNLGSGGSLTLTINNGGDRYCTSFGGAAGGIIPLNTAKVFKIKNATSQPACPPEPAQLCCDLGPLQQCGWARGATECILAGGNPGDGGSECDAVTGLCAGTPSLEGPCCANVSTILGGNCAAGPGMSLICLEVGGTFFSSGVCTPLGICIDLPGLPVVGSAAGAF